MSHCICFDGDLHPDCRAPRCVEYRAQSRGFKPFPEAPVTPKCATPCPDGDACPDARKYGAVHPAPVSPVPDALDFEAVAHIVPTLEEVLADRKKAWEAYDAALQAQHLAALEGVRKELELARGAMRADDERLNAAAVKVWGENNHGCDAADWMADEVLGLRNDLSAAEAERDRMREALEKAEGIVSRFVKARDAFHYDYFGGEVERHLERAMEDAYGFLHGLPDDLRAALGGSNG